MDFIWIIFAMGIIFGTGFGFMKFNPYRWANFKATLLRRNYGLVIFVSHGKSMFPKIKDFDNAVIRTMGGIWILERDKVYRLVDSEKEEKVEMRDIVEKQKIRDKHGVEQEIEVNKSIEVRTPIKNKYVEIPVQVGNFITKRFRKQKKITGYKRFHVSLDSSVIDYRQGCPIIHFDLEDMLPLILVKQGTRKEEIAVSRNPEHVEKTLGKEVAAAELEALKMRKNPILIAIVFCAILSLVAVGLSFQNGQDIHTVGNMVYNLTQIANNKPIVIGG